MINPIYMQEETINKLQDSFQENKIFPAILLLQFLDDKSYQALQKEITNLPFKQEKEALTHSYAKAPLPRSLQQWLESPELIEFLQRVLAQKVKRIESQLFRFSWKDYTILHDEKMEEPGIDFVIDFTPSCEEKAGGDLFYSDGTGEYIKISLSKNTAALIERKEGISKFIKYVNVLANKKKRYLLFGKIILV